MEEKSGTDAIWRKVLQALSRSIVKESIVQVLWTFSFDKSKTR